MEAVLAWGLEFVRGMQAFFGMSFVLPMKVITFLGSEAFVLASLPLLYWCVDRRKGARLAIVVLVSVFLNLFAKNLVLQPRPYDIDPAVGLDKELTTGFPSGHSQTSVTFWGAMLDILPRGLGLAAFIALPILVGISRVYLGVHFPTDVLGGWVLGLLVLGLYRAFGEKVEAMLRKLNTSMRMLVVAILALGMNAALPEHTNMGGAFFGGSAGFILLSGGSRWAFLTDGSLGRRTARYLIGMTGTLALYILPKLLVGDSFPAQAALIRFLRYAIVGFWVAYGAPRLFLALKLADPENASA
ncbi:MAG TPA: phosphatase PAP2 family protein [Rectinemataceae bacterium]